MDLDGLLRQLDALLTFLDPFATGELISELYSKGILTQKEKKDLERERRASSGRRSRQPQDKPRRYDATEDRRKRLLEIVAKKRDRHEGVSLNTLAIVLQTFQQLYSTVHGKHIVHNCRIGWVLN